MKILTATEMKAADNATFETTGVSSLAVMESAGRAVAQYVVDNFELEKYAIIHVLCGAGNNAGDGYVIARTLYNLGYTASVLSTKPIEELRGDALINARSYQALFCKDDSLFEVVDKNYINSAQFEDACCNCDLIVDCLYGTGFKGELTGVDKLLVEKLKELCESPVIAVDIPSGVEVDSGRVCGEAIKADYTIALQCLKPCHVLYPAAEHCGEVIVADIGLSVGLPEIAGIQRELITADYVSRFFDGLEFNPSKLHKGKKGSVLVIGGSQGMYGAPQMSAEAALASGAGIVTLALPKTVFKAIAPKQKELMSFGLADTGEGDFSGEEDKKLLEALKGKKAIAIGPGFSTQYGSRLLLEEVLEYAKEHSIPTVVDADGLNILAEERALFELLGEHVVLTPHPGEMARLCATNSDEVQSERFKYALRLADETGATVILKGAHSIVASPEGFIRVNPVVVETLATAGSGDVLTGVVAALLARGDITPFDAASLAVYIHGMAGEFLKTELKGPIGGKAGDIIQEIPKVINFFIEHDYDVISFFKQVLDARR